MNLSRLHIRLAVVLLLTLLSGVSCNAQQAEKAMPDNAVTHKTENEKAKPDPTDAEKTETQKTMPVSVSSSGEEPVIRLYDGPPSPSTLKKPPVSTASEGHRTDLKRRSEKMDPETTETEKAKTVTTDPTERPATTAKHRVSDAKRADSDEAGIATFGAGCFWCIEAVLQQVEGVLSVESGYCGGTVKNPTYRQICEGDTGHAEVCQIRYDPSKITFDDLLEIFWKTHDPTTLNRQGNDVGTQYRSVVFYHDERQKALARQRKKQLDAAGVWKDPIVTEISPAAKFYKAEDYHQNYYVDNPSQGYCRVVIRPKVEKFRAVFKDRLKKGDR